MSFLEKEFKYIISNAYSLYERIDFLSKKNTKIFPIDKKNQKKIDEWKASVSDNSSFLWQRRLKWDNFTQKKLLSSFSLDLKKEPLPPWGKTLKELFHFLFAYKKKPFTSTHFCKKNDPKPFEEALIPFIFFAREKLKKRTKNKLTYLSKKALRSLENSLLLRFVSFSSSAFFTEFTCFRWNKFSKNSSLEFQVKTSFFSKEIYFSFIQNLLENHFISFFKEYCVLARLFAVAIDNWCNVIDDFLKSFKQDKKEIETTFFAKKELKKISDLNSSLSDAHNGGKTVFLITFSCGEKLVYKPRNIEIDKQFFSLLSWTQKKEKKFTWKILKILPKKNYGWEEYVSFSPCKKKEEVLSYYHEAGRLLCLIYALCGNDCHYENIISVGSHPVLIDLETLFQPKEKNDEEEKFLSIFSEFHKRSVLSTLFLPVKGSYKEGFELSGLAGDKNFLNKKIKKWKEINTDTMHLGQGKRKKEKEIHFPYFNKKRHHPKNYIKDLLLGFQEMYMFLIKEKKSLFKKTSPLMHCNNLISRLVCRNTNLYFKILLNSCRTNYLHSGIDRSIYIDLLSRPFLFSEKKPVFWSIIKKEHSCLFEGDIPKFIFSTGKTDLKTDDSSFLQKNLLEEPSFKTICQHISQLNEKDLKLQEKFINSTIYARYTSIHSDHREKKFPSYNTSFASEKFFLKKAHSIGTFLLKEMIQKENYATWINITQEENNPFCELEFMEYSLYQGTCGIAFFLSSLFLITQEEKFASAALLSLNQLKHLINKKRFKQHSNITGIGGVAGIGSYIYAFTKIAYFLKNNSFLTDALEVSKYIENIIEKDKSYDIISGAAGTILALLSLYRATGKKEVLYLAHLCGQHLIKNAVYFPDSSVAWNSIISTDSPPLTGFAHGTAGIAHALIKLYAATKKEEYLSFGKRAIAYENKHFSPEKCNWPDFRIKTNETLSFANGWCHGSPGIGLSRMSILDIYSAPLIKRDIEASLSSIKKNKLLPRDHICCGNSAIIEYLLTASKLLSKPSLAVDAKNLMGQILFQEQKQGYFSLIGATGKIPDLSLFQGLAGVGYTLLRLIKQKDLPSLLLFE